MRKERGWEEECRTKKGTGLEKCFIDKTHLSDSLGVQVWWVERNPGGLNRDLCVLLLIDDV